MAIKQLPVIGFTLTLISSCADNPTLQFPNEAEVWQRYLGSSTSEITVSSSSAESSSSSATISSSSEQNSSSLVPCEPSAGEFCYDNKKGKFCGNRTQTYDPDEYECKDINPNGIYLIGGLTDEDGNVYNAVLIGEQTWMAENLNINVSGSRCYAEGVHDVSADSIAKNCATYGRLYDWETAIALPGCNDYSCDSSIQIGAKHRGICPSGWHLPSRAEWKTLTDFVGIGAANKLMATTSIDRVGNTGTDEYGFSALLGGLSFDFSYVGVGDGGYWMTSECLFLINCCIFVITERVELVNYYPRSSLISVRCLKD